MDGNDAIRYHNYCVIILKWTRRGAGKHFEISLKEEREGFTDEIVFLIRKRIVAAYIQNHL